MGRGGKKNKNKASDPVPAVTESVEALSLAPSAPDTSGAQVPSTSTQAETPAVKDSEEGGLGLSGSRKKRPRKQKAAQAELPKTAEPPPTTQAVDTAAQRQTSPGDAQSPQQVPEHPSFAPAQQPAPWGAGRGAGQQSSQPPPGHAAGPTRPWGDAPQVGIQQPSQPSVGWGRGQPTSPPGSAPAQQPASSWGMGRGAGRGQQATPDAPGFTSQPPAAQPTRQGQPAQRGPKSAPQQTGRPAQTLQQIVKTRFSIPTKIPGREVRSKPVSLLCNYLEMSIKPLKVYRYDVQFSPDKPKKMLVTVFNKVMQKNFGNLRLAFDQTKNFYASKPLPKVGQGERFVDAVEITDSNGKVMKFEVAIKFTGIVDLQALISYMTPQATSLNTPSEAIQCIDVILHQGTLNSYVKVNRQFFKRPSRPIDLGDGLEMWTGLFQSAIFTTRPYINIDVAHKGFPIAQPLVNVLQSWGIDLNRRIEDQRGSGVLLFRQFIKSLKVVAKLGGSTEKREFICNDIADPPNVKKFEFKEPDGRTKMMTVAQYFEQKQIRLRYPNLNCMWVGPRDKQIYYPIEFLEVAYGQVRNKQLNEMQLRTMVQQAATPPDVRKQKIEEIIGDMNYSSNPYFTEFGLQISNEFTKIDGKILDAPQLDCGGNRPVFPSRGAWRTDQVLQAKSLSDWGVIGVETDARNANYETLVSLFKQVGAGMGMIVATPSISQFGVRLNQLEMVMRRCERLQMLVVVVSTRTRDCYSQVKQVAERSVGLLTQCIKDNTTRRLNQQTVRNILLKVNSKLMGVNQAIRSVSLPRCLAKEDVMVIGADVTHPSPDQSNIPSIAAVTASIDSKCFKYNTEFSIQGPKREIIVEFQDMVVDHLQMYRKERGRLPAKIYVFRDGVSEGQYSQVMESELLAVYEAYARLTGGRGRPQVLFVLVQKRHHTRLFVPNSKNNVEPGTVVDQKIVHPRELDFYLVSHQAIKGTARPTRYHALANDEGLPDDQVEQLAFYLCHLFSRCSRSVSYPTPTYYAHLACERAKALIHNDTFDNQQLEVQPQRLRVKAKIQELSPMFFI